jgi:hypothetical protein
VRRLLVGILLLVARGAHADWKDVTVTVTPAYAVAYIDDRTAHGGGFAVDLGLGLTDALSLHATSALTWHDAPLTKMLPAGSLSAFTAMVGLTYALDVIRLVPSFDLSIGAVGIRGDTTFGSTARAAQISKPVNAFGVSLGFMLDYLLTKHIAVGVEVRYHALLTDLDRVPMYLYAGPRATFRWGK